MFALKKASCSDDRTTSYKKGNVSQLSIDNNDQKYLMGNVRGNLLILRDFANISQIHFIISNAYQFMDHCLTKET